MPVAAARIIFGRFSGRFGGPCLGRFGVVLGLFWGRFGVGSGVIFGVAESAKMCFSLQPEQHLTNFRVAVYVGFGVALVSIVGSFCWSFFCRF